MDIETYKAKLAALHKEYETNKRKIQTEYALANNTYKVGDVITDHMRTIRIEKIQIDVSYMSSSIGKPQCVYVGPELKKDGTPKKNGIITQIYQSNIEK
jgi:hypothetical protein